MEEPLPLAFSPFSSFLHHHMGDHPLGNGAGEIFPCSRTPRGWEQQQGGKTFPIFGSHAAVTPPCPEEVTLPLLAATGPPRESSIPSQHP